MLLKKIAIFFVMFCPISITCASENIVLLFGGDVTFGGHYPGIAKAAYEDFGYSFKNISHIINEGDLFMVNCENPITKSERKITKKFNFKMDPRLTKIFNHNKIGLVNLANNHVFDYGEEGLYDTIKHLNASGVEYVGAGKDLEEARRPIIKEIKGKRIFFFGYGNYSPAGKNSPGVAYRNKEHVIEDIRKAKTQGANIVVINFHWGIERAISPLSGDKKLAEAAIDSGADVIIGHHPHVIQPVQVYKRKVIAYSLGNFIFGGNGGGPKEGMLMKIIIRPNGNIDYQKIILEVNAKQTKYQPYAKK